MIDMLWTFIAVFTIIAAFISATAFPPRLPVVRPVALADRTRPAPASCHAGDLVSVT